MSGGYIDHMRARVTVPLFWFFDCWYIALIHVTLNHKCQWKIYELLRIYAGIETHYKLNALIAAK